MNGKQCLHCTALAASDADISYASRRCFFLCRRVRAYKAAVTARTKKNKATRRHTRRRSFAPAHSEKAARNGGRVPCGSRTMGGLLSARPGSGRWTAPDAAPEGSKIRALLHPSTSARGSDSRTARLNNRVRVLSPSSNCHAADTANPTGIFEQRLSSCPLWLAHTFIPGPSR